MTTENPAVEERRHGTREMIDRLLNERQQMWVLYARLAGVPPYADHDPDPALLEEFMQILVDYIAAAHFGLYERFSNRDERRQGVVRLAEKLYPRIVASTSAALAFNDKYESRSVDEVTDELASDLSKLGEDLAARIELEDQLIDELLR